MLTLAGGCERHLVGLEGGQWWRVLVGEEERWYGMGGIGINPDRRRRCNRATLIRQKKVVKGG